jgi:hypothetical protein
MVADTVLIYQDPDPAVPENKDLRPDSESQGDAF